MTSTMRFDRWESQSGQVYNTVLQVVNAKDSGSAVTSSTNWSTQLGVSITSKLPNSKFLVTAHVYMGFSFQMTSGDNDNYAVGLSRNGTSLDLDTRGSTYMGTGSFAGSDVPITGGGTYGSQYDAAVKSVTYLDAPGTSSAGTTFTYNVLFRNPTSSGIAYYNRSAANSGSGGMTTITVMEIAQ